LRPYDVNETGGNWMPLDERFEPDHDAIRSGGNR
jgi:hypothetical protein